MTLFEALNEITSLPKYHLHGGIKQTTASRTVISIREGTARFNTTTSFLRAFGYNYNHLTGDVTKS